MRRVRGPAALLSALAIAVSAAPADARVATPFLTGTTPSSLGNSTTPVLTGLAETDSVVDVYATADCAGPIVASGTGDSLAFPGIVLSVAAGSTTDFTVTARDALNNISGCSNSVTYVEDETPPGAPTDLASTPESPSNDNNPAIALSAEAGSSVALYASDNCSGSPVATRPVADFASPGVAVTVDSDSTAEFTARATDAAGNTSNCSSALSYVEDSTPPAAPASLSSSPASPSQVRTPQIKGSAQDGSMVVVYADPACKDGTDVASGTAAAFASLGLAVTVGPNSVMSFTARATDAAGNVSTCSAAFTYVEDELAPAAPTGFVLTPSSPANDNTPTLEGTAEAGSRVELWATPDCTGRMIASGTQAAFASPGFDVSVADDTTTTLYAVAIDAAGNTSPCSEGVTYVEDSSSPAPGSLAVSPASPANENAPTVSGSAEALATVRLYPTAGCTGQPLGSGSAAAFASPGIAISVADDTTTVVYVQATDADGNVSPCSAGVTYVEDSTPPDAPSGLTVAPASPANDNAPVVKGLSEPGSTVRLFASSDCGGSPVATATAATFASPGIAVTVADDSTTALRTRATDAAGNASGCSAPVTYREDSTAPSVTLSANTTDTAPVLSGVAGTGTGDSATVTVSLYAGAAAAGAPVATLTATRDGNSGAFSVASAPLAAGTYTARAIQTDSAGNTGASAAVTFSVAGPPVEPPPATTPITPPSPTTPTTPIHPTGVPKAPALRLSQPFTHLDHGHVRLTLSCRGTSAQTCRGTIRLRSESSKSRRGSPAFTGTPVRYSVTGGRSKELRFTLPAAVATAIRTRGHLVIVVAYGPTAALRKTITVRP